MEICAAFNHSFSLAQAHLFCICTPKQSADRHGPYVLVLLGEGCQTYEIVLSYIYLFIGSVVVYLENYLVFISL